MSQVKLSVSLSEDDLAALDRYVRSGGLKSRSAGIQQAIRRLPRPELAESYAHAWQEWEDTEESQAWESVVSDGLSTDASR